LLIVPGTTSCLIKLYRGERMKLEKDYLELQSKAFAAPGGALAEVMKGLQ